MNSSMIQNRIVTVFGAYGHTGRFVVRELLKRGFTPILSGRDASKLKEAGNRHPGAGVRGGLVGGRAALVRRLFWGGGGIDWVGSFGGTAAVGGGDTPAR